MFINLRAFRDDAQVEAAAHFCNVVALRIQRLEMRLYIELINQVEVQDSILSAVLPSYDNADLYERIKGLVKK